MTKDEENYKIYSDGIAALAKDLEQAEQIGNESVRSSTIASILLKISDIVMERALTVGRCNMYDEEVALFLLLDNGWKWKEFTTLPEDDPSCEKWIRSILRVYQAIFIADPITDLHKRAESMFFHILNEFPNGVVRVRSEVEKLQVNGRLQIFNQLDRYSPEGNIVNYPRFPDDRQIALLYAVLGPALSQELATFINRTPHEPAPNIDALANELTRLEGSYPKYLSLMAASLMGLEAHHFNHQDGPSQNEAKYPHLVSQYIYAYKFFGEQLLYAIERFHLSGEELDSLAEKWGSSPVDRDREDDSF